MRTGSAVRCDDAETDSRVNAEGCRTLNVRSIAAVPLLCDGLVVGLLEVFSPRAQAFGDEHLITLQRMSSAVLAAVNRSQSRLEEQPATNQFVTFGEVDNETQPPKFPWRLALIAVFVLSLGSAGASAFWRWPGMFRHALSRVNPVQQSREAAPPDIRVPDQLRMAAESGDANSQFLLGSLYIQGREVPENYEEAAKWFGLAAQQGNTGAQSILGFLYTAGRGVPQDYVSSYLWTRLAADAGNEISMSRLPKITALLSPDQLSEAEKRVAEWRKTHKGPSEPSRATAGKAHK